MMEFILELFGTLLEGALESRKIQLWIKLILVFLLFILLLAFIWYPALSAENIDFLYPILLTVLITALLIALAAATIRKQGKRNRHH